MGGLLFGAGFALIGYCPGSAAAALGVGRLDALFGMAGLVAGSYLYAMCSSWLDKSIATWGDFGKISLPEVFGIARPTFALGLAGVLSFLLLILSVYAP